MLKVRLTHINSYLMALMVCFFSSTLLGQTKSVNFVKQPFNTALEQAAKEKKLVFMDCYTSWCGPCKWMDNNIFNLDDVSDYLSADFIALKMDMEKGEGPALTKKYKVGAYPTFLILDASGNVVYRFVGAKQKEEFLAELAKSKDLNNPVLVMNNRYNAGDRDASFIREFVKQKLIQREIPTATTAFTDFLKMSPIDTVAHAASWFLFAKNSYATYLTYPGSEGFKYFLTNWKSFIPAIGKDSVQSRQAEMYYELTSYCIKGYYKERMKYNAADFDLYRSLLAASNLENKEQYKAMIDMSEAACQGRKVDVTSIFADHVGTMTPKNQRLAFDIWSYVISSPVVDIPRLADISDRILETSKDEFLRKMATSYRNRVLKK